MKELELVADRPFREPQVRGWSMRLGKASPKGKGSKLSRGLLQKRRRFRQVRPLVALSDKSVSRVAFERRILC